MWVPVTISSSSSCVLISRNYTFSLELSSSHPKTFVTLPVSSDNTSSPIFRSLISFCLPDPVVTRVSGPKQAASASSAIHLHQSSVHQLHALALRLRLRWPGCCCSKVRPRQNRFQETPGPCLSVHLPVSVLRKCPLLVLCVSLPRTGGNTGTAPKQSLKQYSNGG